MNLPIYLSRFLILIFLFSLIGLSCQTAHKTTDNHTSVQYFDLQDVELLESPFQHAQDLDKQYLLDLEAVRHVLWQADLLVNLD